MLFGIYFLPKLAFSTRQQAPDIVIRVLSQSQTLIFEHLHKAILAPIIIHHAIMDAPLVSLFGGLVLIH